MSLEQVRSLDFIPQPEAHAASLSLQDVILPEEPQMSPWFARRAHRLELTNGLANTTTSDNERLAEAEARLAMALAIDHFPAACEQEGIIKGLRSVSREELDAISPEIVVVDRQANYVPDVELSQGGRHRAPVTVTPLKASRHAAPDIQQLPPRSVFASRPLNPPEETEGYDIRAAVNRVGSMKDVLSGSLYFTTRAYTPDGMEHDLMCPSQEIAGKVRELLESKGYRDEERRVRRERPISLTQQIMIAEIALAAFNDEDIRSEGQASKRFAMAFGFDESVVGMARAALAGIVAQYDQTNKVNDHGMLTRDESEVLRAALAHVPTNDPHIAAMAADVAASDFTFVSNSPTRQRQETAVDVEPIMTLPTETAEAPEIFRSNSLARVLLSLGRRS